MGLRHAIASTTCRVVAVVPPAVAADAGVVVGVEEGFVYRNNFTHLAARKHLTSLSAST